MHQTLPLGLWYPQHTISPRLTAGEQSPLLYVGQDLIRMQQFCFNIRVIHRPTSDSGTPPVQRQSHPHAFSDAGTPILGRWHPRFIVIHRTLELPTNNLI